MEAANYATRFHPLIKHGYEHKKGNKQRVVAIKAVAHKLARAYYHPLKDDPEACLRLIVPTVAGRNGV